MMEQALARAFLSSFLIVLSVHWKGQKLGRFVSLDYNGAENFKTRNVVIKYIFLSHLLLYFRLDEACYALSNGDTGCLICLIVVRNPLYL